MYYTSTETEKAKLLHGTPSGNIFYGHRFGDVLCEKWLHNHEQMIKFLLKEKMKSESVYGSKRISALLKTPGGKQAMQRRNGITDLPSNPQ